MRKILRALLIGLLMAGLATGCGKDSGSGGGNPTPGSSSSTGPDTPQGGVGGY